MATTAAQQITLDNALVAPEKRVKIGKCNMRIDPEKTQKEPTYLVVLDTLALTTCYPAFLITAEIPYSERFSRYVLDFRIKNLMNLPLKKKLSPSSRNLATLEKVKNITAVGMYYKKNIDFVALLWEDFAFQIDNRDAKKQEKMYYPIFTKAIIHHFLSKDKSISMRNKMFMHTAQDDCILVMTTPKIRDSPAYQTYLAFATGAATPKSKRIYKKPASPSKKRTLVTVEEEEPEPAKKSIPSKKPAAKRQSAGGIELLSDAAILEEAQLKKALKRSKRETNIHQACGSSEGADFKSEVPDEPKGKLIDTSEGSGLKPGVPDVSKGDSSKSEYESWGDSGDEANVQDDEDVQDSDYEPQHVDDERTNSENQETNNDEEETEDEFVHTPLNYVPTDDETNDESNDVTEEEYERINEELYGNVNISLTDVEPADKEKDDEEMTIDGHVNINQVGAVISMMDINVQHEIPRTSSLLTIPVSVIPEHTVINPSKTVTTASATIISSLLSSLFPSLQQLTPIPTPTTTEATTSTTAIPDSETLTALHQRIADFEKDVKELKDVDNSRKFISTIQSEVPKAV
ncbi:hypothetical protein Tco_0374159 [Tanacetum coccineum]